MTQYSLPYGSKKLYFNIPDHFHVDTLLPNAPEPLKDPMQAIQSALASPIGERSLLDFSGVESVGIAVNDKTRPVPNQDVLSPLLVALKPLGVPEERIIFYIGAGTHSMSSQELPRILSQDIIDQHPVIIHDCDTSTMIDLGETTRGTTIKINADFFNCDLKITVGNIEPHHFMGFSGGVKTAAIGLASRETITQNHAMLPHPKAKTGIFHINPMRQDLEEIGRKIGVHFSLSTILDEGKNILKAYFGDPQIVMRQAIPSIREIFGAKVSEPYDLVIASPGGAPKDINLYQAEKGLTQAANITKKDGWIVLLAACPEGSGSQKYEDYVTNTDSHEAIIEQFRKGFFKVGPHKAYQIAQEAIKKNIVLVSDISPEKVKSWKLTPSTPDLIGPLIEWISERLPDQGRIAILPNATHTMTEVKK